MLSSNISKPENHNYKNNTACPEEINKAFEADSRFLKWLAELITGDPEIGEQCVADARKLTKERSGVFSNWLGQWARSATIDRAIAHGRNQINAASQRYVNSSCSHGGHVPLAAEEVDSLWNAREK